MKKEGVLAGVAILFVTVVVACNKAGNQPAEQASQPQAAVAQKPKVAVSPNAWQVPADVQPQPASQTDWLNFGWQTFVALDWPALSPNSGGVMGQPDTSSTIGATAGGAIVPAVWNTFRDVSTIMLANGVDPGSSYNKPTVIAGSCTAMGSGNPVAPGFQPLYVDNSTFTQATLPKSYTNEAFTGPLVDQGGWYTLEQIFVAPSEYAYIQGNGYYLGQNQVNAYKQNGSLVGFPKDGQGLNLPTWAQYGALEIKATWRVLDPNVDKNVLSRYYTQWGYFMQADGTTCQGPTLFGLIGLHILRLTPSTGATWFWASFEQIDNTEPPSGVPATLAANGTPNGACTTPPYNVTPNTSTGNIPWNGSNTPNNICQVTQIPSYVQTVNQSWQSQLQGTVWQYYQMVNTLNPCSTGDASCYTFYPIYDKNNTINLNAYANTAIESYFQSFQSGSTTVTSTCMSCHGSAAGDGAPSTMTGNNQIFTFVLMNAYLPPSLTATATGERQKLLRLFRHPPAGKLAVNAKPKDTSK